MRRDLERRLRRVQIASTGSKVFVCIDQGDGTVRGPRGELMTREKAEALGRAGGTFTIFINEIDARL